MRGKQAHHFPRLALHESRRLRHSSVNLHELLSSTESPIVGTREALLSELWLDQPSYVGAWCCSAFDGDRMVRAAALRSWDSVLSDSPTDEQPGISLTERVPSMISFLSDLISTQDEPASADPDDVPTSDASILRTQSLLSLAYLVSCPISIEEDSIKELLQSEELWDHLDKEKESSSATRAAAYEVLEALVQRTENDLLRKKEGLLETVARIVLTNCWAERDGWTGVVAFLRCECRLPD